MYDRLEELQALLHKEIPITQHFHLSVGAYTQQLLRLDAPLAENINHAGTAFGGSLNALLTLACWSMVWFVLQEYHQQGEIIIQDCSCKYLYPVKHDFSACCYRPSSFELDRFHKTLLTRGRSRIELKAEIVEGEQVAVSFIGRYVVLLT